MDQIAIVIVNYKTPELVVGCLNSLQAERAAGADFQVFIGDAESQDDSVEIINAHIKAENMTWALCYDLGQNGGFAFGNNAILKDHVLHDPRFSHVYFLNPDTYIHPNAIAALRSFLDTHPNVGVVGSRLENPDGSGRAYGFRAPTPWREFFRGARFGLFNKWLPSVSMTIANLKTNAEVDWVTGASFMMPRKVLEQVGLMDDAYFLYFEETDLMMRVRNAGYAVWHVAGSRVVHLAGQATGVRNAHGQDPEPIARLSPFWLQSRKRFFRRHYGKFQAGLATVLFLTGDLIYRIHRILRRRPIENPPHLWRDYLCVDRAPK